jgi:hypothetical protein
LGQSTPHDPLRLSGQCSNTGDGNADLIQRSKIYKKLAIQQNADMPFFAPVRLNKFIGEFDDEQFFRRANMF